MIPPWLPKSSESLPQPRKQRTVKNKRKTSLLVTACPGHDRKGLYLLEHPHDQSRLHAHSDSDHWSGVAPVRDGAPSRSSTSVPVAAEKHKLTHEWMHFLLSCPVETVHTTRHRIRFCLRASQKELQSSHCCYAYDFPRTSRPPHPNRQTHISALTSRILVGLCFW